MSTNTKAFLELGSRVTGHVLDPDTWHRVSPARLVRGEVVGLFASAPAVATIRLSDGSTVVVRRRVPR